MDSGLVKEMEIAILAWRTRMEELADAVPHGDILRLVTDSDHESDRLLFAVSEQLI